MGIIGKTGVIACGLLAIVTVVGTFSPSAEAIARAAKRAARVLAVIIMMLVAWMLSRVINWVSNQCFPQHYMARLVLEILLICGSYLLIHHLWERRTRAR